MTFLTSEQIAFFHENGFLHLPNFWTGDQVSELRDHMQDLLTTADLTQVHSIFTTDDQTRKLNDDYFLNSGYTIRYFWEEKAWAKDGQLLVSDRRLAINKVGHALHDLDPLFQSVSYDGKVGSIVHELGLEHPLLAQSMYIFKQPHIGGSVNPHQDGTFLYTEPQSCIGLWWALDDCSLENGCLWAVPGSHRLGVHRHYRRRDPPLDGTEFVPSEQEQWDLTNAVPLETPKGSLVVLHGALVHYSADNLSDKPRHAYAIHIVEGKEGVVYPKNNWLQRPPEHPFNEIVNRV